MFTFLSRFRRQTAVLTALALVASVLVAVPVSAADDPEPSLKSKFSACVGDATEDRGFTDVLDTSNNAGDINCIAYYNITMGKSATTYDPLASVTREEMALFLTRLAKRVGIAMVDDPADPGFTDIGDLSEESQTAIAQLRELGITKGNNASGTTYGPGGQVTRGQMALFIARLMKDMTPYGGDKSTDAHTPSDVDDLDSDDVGSPFTDLDRVTKETYDAITNLYELGVIVTGISETGYAPSASIRRDHMAVFMTGVMGHSNLRPAGLSIQASDPSTFGANDGSVVVSVRDDDFAAVPDQTVEVFGSDAGAFDEDGACKTDTGSCTWNDGNDEELTDESGNITTDGGAARGKTHWYYAWIGTEDEEKFDVDDTDHVYVKVESMNEELAMKVTTSISEHADGYTADLDRGGSVTVTVQLVDTADPNSTPPGAAADGAKNVARAGIEIDVSVTRTTDPDSADDTNNRVVYNNSRVTTLTTDEDGKATYVVNAPDDDNDNDDQQVGDIDDATADPPTTHTTSENLENRNDLITFIYKKDPDRTAGEAANASITIQWKEDNPVTTSAVSTAPAYILPDKDGDLAITASVTLYDQYGNGIREGGVGQKAAIGIGLATADAEPQTDGTDNVNVNRNGVATRRVVIKKVVGTTDNNPGIPVFVGFNERPLIDDDDDDVVDDVQTDVEEITGDDNPADHKSVQVVTRANDDDVGSVTVNALRNDHDEFLANDGTTGVTEGNSNLVYSYHSGDTFVNGVPNPDAETEGELLTMEKFEDMLDDYKDGGIRAMVDVVVYNPDGSSIFRVTRSAATS